MQLTFHCCSFHMGNFGVSLFFMLFCLPSVNRVICIDSGFLREGGEDVIKNKQIVTKKFIFFCNSKLVYLKQCEGIF